MLIYYDKEEIEEEEKENSLNILSLSTNELFTLGSGIHQFNNFFY